MSNRRFQFSWFKDYFQERFPFVRKVEVEAHKEGPELFEVRARANAGGRWYVVRKRGPNPEAALNLAKLSLAHKVRKEWNRLKRHPVAVPIHS